MTEPFVLLPETDFTAVLQAFHQSNCTVADLVIALLTEKRFKRSTKLAELLRRSGDILKVLLSHTRLPASAKKVASEAMRPLYAKEIHYLMKSTTGWHFSAHTAMPEDIDDFDLDTLASDTAKHAPLLSVLFDSLLSAKKKLPCAFLPDDNVEISMDVSNASSGEDEAALEGTFRTPSTSPDHEEQKKTNPKQRREHLLRIICCFVV